MLREIVIDTETTGLDCANGDRLIEVGCIEIVNRIPTGREFHRYLNPERDIHRDAIAVHGLTPEFLKDKPLFKAVAGEFLDFIGEAPLVMHNASFDVGFLNAELARVALPPLASERVVDTLLLARRRHPPAPTASMRCASATASTIRCAPSTAPWSTPCCSPASTSSSWASGRRRWAWQARERHSPAPRCACAPPSRARARSRRR